MEPRNQFNYRSSEEEEKERGQKHSIRTVQRGGHGARYRSVTVPIITEPTIDELKSQFLDESGRMYESVAGDLHYLMMLQQDAQSSARVARTLELYNKISSRKPLRPGNAVPIITEPTIAEPTIDEIKSQSARILKLYNSRESGLQARDAEVRPSAWRQSKENPNDYLLDRVIPTKLTNLVQDLAKRAHWKSKRKKPVYPIPQGMTVQRADPSKYTRFLRDLKKAGGSFDIDTNSSVYCSKDDDEAGVGCNRTALIQRQINSLVMTPINDHYWIVEHNEIINDPQMPKDTTDFNPENLSRIILVNPTPIPGTDHDEKPERPSNVAIVIAAGNFNTWGSIAASLWPHKKFKAQDPLNHVGVVLYVFDLGPHNILVAYRVGHLSDPEKCLILMLHVRYAYEERNGRLGFHGDIIKMIPYEVIPPRAGGLLTRLTRSRSPSPTGKVTT
ncbi:MAG: hypothetical protein CBC12_07190 [Candidatus Puniceispirillum sp. TMED52]|nr:MAG: hypothetical protein CBC12_07190 [Candidatus Puniceispirillum sp. TMED52]